MNIGRRMGGGCRDFDVFELHPLVGKTEGIKRKKEREKER